MRATRTIAVVCGALSSLVLGCGAQGDPASEPPAGAASALPAGAITIYDDALRAGWADWSWGSTRNFAATSPVASGTRSLAVTYSAWGALYLRRTTASITGATTLSLMVNGGTNSGLALAAIGVKGTTQLTRVDLAPYCAAKAIPRGAWTRCQVPLSALGPAGTVFDAFQIQERNGTAHAAVFFDDVGLTGAVAPTPPAAPTGLAATAASGAVSLSWSAASGATGYDVWRATSATGTFARLTAAAQAATTYRDAAVAAGATYWYRVTASNAAGAGPASAVVSATVPAPAPVTVTISPAVAALDACAKTKFTATVSGSTDGSVTWSVQEGAAGGTIDASGNYTAPSGGGTYHVLARSNASTATSASTATATVTVTERVLSVAVTPTSASTAAGGQVQLVATVTTTCGTSRAQ